MPNLYIIAGHNGAGKSTYGKSLLPPNAQNLTIFDSDLVFSQKLKFFASYIKVHKSPQLPHWFTEFLTDLV